MIAKNEDKIRRQRVIGKTNKKTYEGDLNLLIIKKIVDLKRFEYTGRQNERETEPL